ncbi:MAG TPA: ribosome assembly factor SBDS [Geobacterales bacterium]|nr:ribosome assembly factor SBDS [Geobacterales bacterium]
MPKVVARYVSHGERFEIIVDSELAWEYRLGKRNTLDNVLESDIIYKDANKGEKAPSNLLQKVFGTTDTLKIADTIIKKGELPITAERRNKLIEENKKRIIDIIARNCIDTRTNAPLPPSRIELALEEAKVRIDPFKDAESQAAEIIKLLKRVLPIKESKALISLEIPSEFASKVYNQIISKTASVLKSDWKNDGSWAGEIEIPAGLQQSLMAKLNELTKGKVIVKSIKVS